MDKLKDYQLRGVEFILQKKGRAILADEAGLGKTYTTLEAIQRLQSEPVLIFSINPGLYVWHDELSRWYDKKSIVYSGPPEERGKLREKFFKDGIKYLIANYFFIDEIKNEFNDINWKTIVTDEYHIMGISNSRTKRFGAILPLVRKADHIIMVTGSPVRRNLSNLYAPFNLLDPYTFSSFWEFVNKYCIITEDRFGKTIEEMPKNPEKFDRLRKNYLIRRLKENVLKELPPKTRQPISVFMSPEQKELYEKMDSDMYIEYGDNIITAPNEAVKLLRLRQLLVTPLIFDIPIIGGALEMLIELIKVEFSNDNPVAIFTPFRTAIKPIMEVLKERLGKPEVLFCKLHGGMSVEKTHDNVSNFQNATTVRKIFIATIKSGMAITITQAKVAIFIGYEWTSEENSQAEDRLHRQGQLDNVRILYLLHRDNETDEKVRQILNSKQRAINWTLYTKEMLLKTNVSRETII
jgi:SWI/SNF-related matrix-associated actin-dependent regulator 1 of chromatin subfamily A